MSTGYGTCNVCKSHFAEIIDNQEVCTDCCKKWCRENGIAWSTVMMGPYIGKLVRFFYLACTQPSKANSETLKQKIGSLIYNACTSPKGRSPIYIE